MTPNIVLQCSTGWAYGKQLAVSRPTWEALAKTNEMRYSAHTGDWKDTLRGPHWLKIWWLLKQFEELPDGALVVYADVDTAVLNTNANVYSVPVTHVASRIHYSASWKVNSGVMFIRLSRVTREFFKQVWDAGPVPGRGAKHDERRMQVELQTRPWSFDRLPPEWADWYCSKKPLPNAIVKIWHGALPEASIPALMRSEIERSKE
jgi:hypothetical protein